jgi:hypothetical protein
MPGLSLPGRNYLAPSCVAEEWTLRTDDKIRRLTPEQGIAFLEHLAHNLTIMVRVAAEQRRPYGTRTEEQTRDSMYWINEALHNVVQLTRDLRIGRETWDSERIVGWVEMWLAYKHAGQYVQTAVERAFRDLGQPWNQEFNSKEGAT